VNCLWRYCVLFVKSGEQIIQQSFCFLFIILYKIEEEDCYIIGGRLYNNWRNVSLLCFVSTEDRLYNNLFVSFLLSYIR